MKHLVKTMKTQWKTMNRETARKVRLQWLHVPVGLPEGPELAARGRGGRGGPKRGAAAGGRKPAQKPANKDQLDQELDSFMKER